MADQPNLILQGIPLPELIAQLRSIVREEVRAKVSEELDEKLLSATEACKLFEPAITRTTLESYAAKDHFKKYYLEGRTWFRRSEILSALSSIKRYSRDRAA